MSPKILIVRFGVWHKHQCFPKVCPTSQVVLVYSQGLESLQKRLYLLQRVYMINFSKKTDYLRLVSI